MTAFGEISLTIDQYYNADSDEEIELEEFQQAKVRMVCLMELLLRILGGLDHQLIRCGKQILGRQANLVVRIHKVKNNLA